MSIEKVREHFTTLGIADRIMEFDVSSATVELAAKAVGVEGARIAKTLSFMLKDEPILIVVAGDGRVDNKKYKQYKPNISDIEEMIDYNIKLVWLHESVIPETITMFMNQQEYKQYDINYIKSNFKVLLDENDFIKNLFEGF